MLPRAHRLQEGPNHGVVGLWSLQSTSMPCVPYASSTTTLSHSVRDLPDQSTMTHLHNLHYISCPLYAAIMCYTQHACPIAGAQHRPIIEFAIDDTRKLLKRRQRLSRPTANTNSKPAIGGPKSYTPVTRSATGQRQTRRAGASPTNAPKAQTFRQKLGTKRLISKQPITQTGRQTSGKPAAH
jgi:hypothetical protein